MRYIFLFLLTIFTLQKIGSVKCFSCESFVLKCVYCRNMKPEVRKAQREQAIRALKEKNRAAKAKKPAVGCAAASKKDDKVSFAEAYFFAIPSKFLCGYKCVQLNILVIFSD